MARNNETTTRFKVDISELKRSMQEARRQVSLANSEFRSTSSTMDDWRNSAEGVNAKLKQLRSNLSAQENVLAEYERVLEEIREEYGENSAEAVEYTTRLNNQRATVNDLRREISNYEERLEEVTEAERTAARTGQDVADVLADVGNEAEDAGDGFTVLKGAVATFAGNVLTGLVSGLKDAIGSLMTLSDETREYRNQMNKLNSAGSEAGYGVDYVKEKYKDLYGVLADETATTTTISNFMALGAEEETLNSLLNSSIGIWSKYGDSIPLDGLAESINETSKVGQVTGGLADALNWAGISEDNFNTKLEACTSEQERQKLIADTLSSTYGNLSKSYQESNKSIIDANKANADYTDTMAIMGAKIEPVTTSLKSGFTELLQELLKLVADVDMEAFTAKIEEGFAVLKDDVLPAVKNGLGWILENKDAIIAGLAGIATGFVAFKIAGLVNSATTAIKGMAAAQWALNAAQKANVIGLIIAAITALVAAFIYLWNNCDSFREFWIGIWEKIKEACTLAVEWIGEKIAEIGKFFTETVPNFFKGLIEWIKANWLSILLFLINPFAGLFKYFYDNNSKFKEFVDNAIKYIKEFPSKIWTWLVNTMNKVTEWSGNMINKSKETASNFVNKIIEWVKSLPSKVFDWLSSTLKKVTSWGGDLVSKGKKSASDLVIGIVSTIKDLPSKFISVGSDVIGGLWKGISGAVGGLYDNIKNSLSGLVDKAKNALGINSPSKVFAEEVGKWIPEGIAVGISKNAKSALNAMRDLTADSLGSARAGLNASGTTTGSVGLVRGGVVNNFYQTINSPKQLSRLDIYRQSKNLLGYKGGGL